MPGTPSFWAPPAIPSEGGVALTLPAALQDVDRVSGSPCPASYIRKMPVLRDARQAAQIALHAGGKIPSLYAP